MSLVVEFVLPPEAGETVEDCLRTTLEPYFSQFALALEPRYTVLIDNEGRFSMVPTARFRLTAGGKRERFTEGMRAELEQTMHDCFVRAATPNDYSVEWEA